MRGSLGINPGNGMYFKNWNLMRGSSDSCRYDMTAKLELDARLFWMISYFC
jgi:hypothetical protein